MGIPKLNRYLNDNCNKGSIKKTHLKILKGKTLVIDTSIYLYKFISNGDLLEQMYLFISILKSYDIKPIFIFDGKDRSIITSIVGVLSSASTFGRKYPLSIL